MNPTEWDEQCKRARWFIHPNPGQAVFGPYTDPRARIADRIVWVVCALAFVAALVV